jgi:signal transduction histidine kinase
MSVFQRYRWFVLAGLATLVFAVLSLAMPKGPVLTTISDLTYFLLTLLFALTMFSTALREKGANCRFWALMAAGALLWAYNQFFWLHYEVFLHKPLPDPSFSDVVLFLHIVPMIAAVGLRPHVSEGQQKLPTGALDFLLLLVWWVFLYAFVVFPTQYISLNVAAYDRTWGVLYDIEGCVFLLVIGLAARAATAGWKAVYLNLTVAGAVYALDSQLVNVAFSRGKYYSGCLYDVPLVAAMSWMVATAFSARQWQLEPAPPRPNDRWSRRSLRLAMLAILTLPVLGLWTYCWDPSPSPARTFRLFTVLFAMLVMGVFVFLRQYIQDQALIDLLRASRRTFENEQRLQTHLVQREKLASLGQLIAGAAQEIDNPLTDIMDYSEKLWSNQRLSPEQDSLVRKIVNHSQRTRELVANLLSFSQQRSGEKMMVDLRILLQRSVQMREQMLDQKIRIETDIDPKLPKIWGDGHQLFQAFVQVVENAIDALEENRGGVLQVSAQCHFNEVIVRFSDSGPGIKEPNRVFDPFYTTKPIGKGTGLGLSAVYGVVQDHAGQITCQNKPDGGALFTLRLPVGKQADPQALAAAHS